MSFLKYSKQLLMLVTLVLVLPTAWANPLVRISTTFGDFTVELFEEEAPQTVQNFLNYVDRGDYEGMIVHRTEPGFVVQAGGYRFVPFRGPVSLRQDSPVVNEPGISNTRGTLAMAKLGDNPDSATNQWFVNLADNSGNLDEQNGGFTVFGRVLGDGMEVVDVIAEVARFNLDSGAGAFSTVPLRDFTGPPPFPVDRHFVKMTAARVVRHSGAPTVFESATGRLTVRVNAGETLGNLSLHMYLVPSGPELIFEVNPQSIIEFAHATDETATFDAATGVLDVPRVEANLDGDIQILTDLVFQMVDEAQLRFRLESWQE